MRESPLGKVVIVGGGTAGWMTAAVLANVLEHRFCEVHLVDSPGADLAAGDEASLPSLVRLNQSLGLDEAATMRAARATYRLGTKFVNWVQAGHSYFHAFGRHGADVGVLEFPHYWRRFSHEQGEAAGSLADYSLPTVVALARKFGRAAPDAQASLAPLEHGLHLDAHHYAALLRDHAVAGGIRRHQGIPAGCEKDEGGFVTALRLEDGRRLDGDLFIDCTEQRGLLIGEALGVGYEDWTRWLPCDRVVAVDCARIEDPVPYTRASAQRAGWQWRLPLQLRTGNGHVYCSAFVDDDEATQTLLANLDGEPLDEPFRFRFTPGRRTRCWDRNVVAIGSAAGFLEPLEWTGLHLAEAAIRRLVRFFPDRGFCQADIDRYNAEAAAEHDRIRDFLILHYQANRRTEPFWAQCRAMDVPASLAEKLELFRSRGRIADWRAKPFGGDGWSAVLEGQGVRPERYHPLADALPAETLRTSLARLREAIVRTASALPAHGDFIREHCAAEPQTATVQADRVASTARA